MQLSHTRPVTAARFDDPNLVSTAGLVPIMALARDNGLLSLADEHLSVPTDKGAHAGHKIGSLVAGMVAGATASPTWRCCGTGRWAHPSTAHTRPRRWDRSCAPSPSGTSANLMPPPPGSSAAWPPAPRWWPASTPGGCWSTSTIRSSKCTASANKAPATATPGFVD